MPRVDASPSAKPVQDSFVPFRSERRPAAESDAANAEAKKISRLSHDERRFRRARQAFDGRPRWRNEAASPASAARDATRRTAPAPLASGPRPPGHAWTARSVQVAPTAA